MSTPYVQAGEPLHEFLRSFWQRQIDAAEQETPDYRHPPLPLARIKKVMKSDPEVKGLVAVIESCIDVRARPAAPILFCKACEMFISEITARAFIIADSNKRRTLSRSDISKALSKSDQFDFLIDIVPRDDAPFTTPSSNAHPNLGSGGANGASGSGETISGAQEQHGRGETENEEEDDKVDEDGVQPDMLEQAERDLPAKLQSISGPRPTVDVAGAIPTHMRRTRLRCGPVKHQGPLS
ncbi:hypothetical protein HWV62_31887 [Athelia sp. TMB]|nr:hypothetical protein HWV62_31887 [Athelia sp. TMB]